MPVGWAHGALCFVALIVATAQARAQSSRLPQEPDSVPADAEAQTESNAASSPAQNVVVPEHGLVPLSQLRRARNEGLWFYDFRFHSLEFGAFAGMLSVENQTPGEDPSGRIDYGGLFGAYYFPVFGYSRHLSVGILPGLQAGIGGIFSGGTNSGLSDYRAGSTLGTWLAVPVYAVARLGAQASRYATWKVALGVGIGVSLQRVVSGDPISDKSSFVMPSVRLEAGIAPFKVAVDIGLKRAPSENTPTGAPQLFYEPLSVGMGFVYQTDPED